MPPVTVENMERVVVHVRLLAAQGGSSPRRATPGPGLDRPGPEETFGDRCLGQVLVGDVMLTLLLPHNRSPECRALSRSLARVG